MINHVRIVYFKKCNSELTKQPYFKMTCTHKKIYIFKDLLFDWFFGWVFVAAHRLLLVAVSGGYSLLCCVGFSFQRGFSCCRASPEQALGIQASGVEADELSSCDTWA